VQISEKSKISLINSFNKILFYAYSCAIPSLPKQEDDLVDFVCVSPPIYITIPELEYLYSQVRKENL
jgi:hypothetical protein